MHLQIFAIHENGDREEITDLYWFEENGVSDWRVQGVGGPWRFEILVDRQVVFDSVHPEATWSSPS
jgi:hypothetical protein